MSEIVWPQGAKDARNAVNARIPESLRISKKYPPGSDVRIAAKESGFLTPAELELTDFTNDATSILEAIRENKVSAVAVVTAFAKRAAIAHQVTNCLTDFFLEEAIERAKELDAIYAQTGKLVGPLHGLPISVKDNQSLAGHYTTFGFLTQWGKYKEETNGHLLQILWDAGAVFYVKTNVPQACMHLETHSFWGQVLNPYNTNLTPGGSSGGDSALLAFGGSPLGLGNDIGGSLRSPSGGTGLWTLKATTLRVPSAGESPALSMPGADSIASSQGPMGRSLRDIKLWFEVVMASKPWLKEYNLVPIPWGSAGDALPDAGQKPRIGVMWTDEVVTPQPPIQRALKSLVNALTTQDIFEIVDYTPYKHADIAELTHELYFVDGGTKIRDLVAESGEPLLPLTEWVVTHPSVKDHNVHELWTTNLKRESLRAEYLKHFNKQNVDFILCPVGPGPAPALQTAKYWGYTLAWNFLDYPAAVFPTGLHADPVLDSDVAYVQAESLNDDDAYNRSCYKPEVLSNVPLCLQLVGRRHSDDMVLDALEHISKVLPLL